MNELWVDIKGYEGLYQVSNLGRVRSLDHFASNGVSTILYKGRIIKTWLDGKRKYLIVVLSKGKVNKVKKLVHRLVAEHFILNPENKPEVNHIDGDKQNNYASNLEWVTSKENKEHAWKIGLYNTEAFYNRENWKSIRGVIRDSKPNSKRLTINGVTKTLYKWSKELDYSYHQLRYLYDKGGDLPNGWSRETI